MPKLPTNESARDSQLLEKSGWSRGTVGEKKVWVPKFKPPAKSHLKLVFAIVVVLLVLVGVYVGAVKLFPDLLNRAKTNEEKVEELVIPIDISKINFPSETSKQEFLTSTQQANAELNHEKRYQLIARTFVQLSNFYAYDHSQVNRVELEKMRDWIKEKYPKEYENNLVLYEFTCLDPLCEEIQYPAEIVELMEKVEAMEVIDVGVRNRIILNVETAAHTKDDTKKGYEYVNVLASLDSEYQRIGDQRVLDAYNDLRNYISSNFPQVVIPEPVAP